jgi:hypothetical protein
MVLMPAKFSVFSLDIEQIGFIFVLIRLWLTWLHLDSACPDEIE